MIATFFLPPNGRQEVHEITEVEPQDASFFEQNRIKVSMEQLMTGDYTLYADTGKLAFGEPDELIVISRGRSCRECLTELRKLCEKRFADEQHDLYTDTDEDAPESIKDRNGNVALNLCKKCGRGEAELTEPCRKEEIE